MLIFNYLMIVSAVLICLCAEASVAFKVNRQWVASLLSTAGLILAHIISLSCFALALAASCYLFVCLQLDKHCVNKLYLMEGFLAHEQPHFNPDLKISLLLLLDAKKQMSR